MDAFEFVDEEENLYDLDTNSIESLSSASFFDTNQHSETAFTNANLNARFENKQIETLKHLRHLLSENRMLKQRIEIVESELEKYQELKPILALKVNTEIQTDQWATRVDQIFHLKHPTINELEKEEELDELEEVKAIECAIEPVRDLEGPIGRINQIDKSSRIENSFNDELRMQGLNSQMENMQLVHEEELRHLNKMNAELKQNFTVLNEKLANLEDGLRIANKNLLESEKNNLELLEENKEIVQLKRKIDLLSAENQQLFSELKSRQTDLEDTNSKFLHLTKTLNESMRIIEEQKFSLHNLEMENERHAREKHIDCQSKINELLAQNEELKQTLDKRSENMQQLLDEKKELEKQVLRYKSDLKNFNFKEFVSMKRELNALKQEKEERSFANPVKVSVKDSLPPLFPPIKSDSKKNPNNFFN